MWATNIWEPQFTQPCYYDPSVYLFYNSFSLLSAGSLYSQFILEGWVDAMKCECIHFLLKSLFIWLLLNRHFNLEFSILFCVSLCSVWTLSSRVSRFICMQFIYSVPNLYYSNCFKPFFNIENPWLHYVISNMKVTGLPEAMSWLRITSISRIRGWSSFRFSILWKARKRVCLYEELITSRELYDTQRK
jgi:hypothetical protein